MVNGAVISTMGDLGETQIALELHRTTLCWLVGWLVGFPSCKTPSFRICVSSSNNGCF